MTRSCTHKSRLVSSGWSLSALPPEADMLIVGIDVCYVPKADARPALSSWTSIRDRSDGPPRVMVLGRKLGRR